MAHHKKLSVHKHLAHQSFSQKMNPAPAAASDGLDQSMDTSESIEDAQKAISALGEDHPHPAPNETPETHMAFSLAWMTEDARYNLRALHKMKGNDATVLESLFEFLETMSKNPWSYTKKRDKYSGGWEEMPIEQMNSAILDGVDLAVAKDIQAVMVFRFNKSKDRLVALKEGDVLYLLGFDLHFNLYDHGS